MGYDLRLFALRLKVIEMIERYYRVRSQLYTLERWKKHLIHPN